jgi:hypothetical protein
MGIELVKASSGAYVMLLFSLLKPQQLQSRGQFFLNANSQVGVNCS